MPNGDAQLIAVGDDHVTRQANTGGDESQGANGARAFAARRVAITGESTGSVYLIGIGG